MLNTRHSKRISNPKIKPPRDNVKDEEIPLVTEEVDLLMIFGYCF
jgi:hypothetical protein